jgi:hypothetical protein
MVWRLRAGVIGRRCHHYADAAARAVVEDVAVIFILEGVSF